MNSALKLIIFEEKEVLQELLNLLDIQHELILNKDIMALEKVAKDLNHISKKLATIELKRREIVQDIDFIETIENSEDIHVKEAFENIKSNLYNLQIQKDTNDLLIKQQLFFTTKMLNVIKAPEGNGTYNSYGRIGK